MENLNFINDVLCWNNKTNCLIQKNISELYYAYYNQINELIIAESGANYIPKKIFAFQNEGTLLYEFIPNVKLTWYFDNNEYSFENSGLYQIIFAYKIGKIPVLIKNNEFDEIQILNLDSSLVCNFKSDKKNKFDFLEQTQDNLILVISSEQSDSFGRNQYRYSINEDNCILKKIGLNY